MTDEERHPWQRRPDETDKAWEAFCVYRDMGAKRSLRALYEGDDVGSPPSWISRWSSKYDWVDRSAAWDEHLDAQRREVTIQEERSLAALLVEARRAMARKLLEAVEAKDPSSLDIDDLEKLHSMATDVVENGGLHLHEERTARIPEDVLARITQRVQARGLNGGG